MVKINCSAVSIMKEHATQCCATVRLTDVMIVFGKLEDYIISDFGYTYNTR